MKRLVGIHIGGTNSLVSLGNASGKLFDSSGFLTEELGDPDHVCARLMDEVDLLCKRHSAVIDSIGIVCGSPLDPERGIIQSPPNLPQWMDVAVVKLFAERFKVPTFLDNDANGAALAEHHFGAGRGIKNMVFITFGTGCGAGLILNGRVYRGTNCFAGEIGHVRLAEDGPLGYHKRGSMEGFCSGGGFPELCELVREGFKGTSILGPQPSAKEIGAAAEKGDLLAKEVLRVSGDYFGRGVAMLMDILNPELIVVGSIFARCERFIRPAMEARIEREALSYTRSVCRVVPSALGNQIGDYAALAVAVAGRSV